MPRHILYDVIILTSLKTSSSHFSRNSETINCAAAVRKIQDELTSTKDQLTNEIPTIN